MFRQLDTNAIDKYVHVGNPQKCSTGMLHLMLYSICCFAVNSSRQSNSHPSCCPCFSFSHNDVAITIKVYIICSTLRFLANFISLCCSTVAFVRHIADYMSPLHQECFRFPHRQFK